MRTLKFLTGFLILNLYLRWIPRFLNGSEALWLMVFLFFFPLAYGIAKWSSGAGWKELGLHFHRRWKSLFFTGVAIGGVTWFFLTLAELLSGSLQFLAWQPIGAAGWLVVQALVVAVLGSATNDLMVRGYVFAHWKDRLPAVALVLFSTVLYVADDAWLEGWTVRNTVFSVLLGLAFAIAVLRTKSLWLNTGLHAGLNLVYFLVYGFGGEKVNTGLFTSLRQSKPLSPYYGIFAALVVLALTLWWTKKISRKENDSRMIKPSGLFVRQRQTMQQAD